jgi:SH3-like domain-containing protein
MTRAMGVMLGVFALLQRAFALDFASTIRPAILYDAPSAAAEKVAVVSSGYPLERIVTTAGWVKVRDETGSLLWIEDSALGKGRTLRIKVPVAQILESPSDIAPPSFRASQGVTLEIVAPESAGWIKVRHASGQEGYLRISDAWGL